MAALARGHLGRLAEGVHGYVEQQCGRIDTTSTCSIGSGPVFASHDLYCAFLLAQMNCEAQWRMRWRRPTRALQESGKRSI
eukprot:5639454-Pleurochrysis_carterae.AAC.1